MTKGKIKHLHGLQRGGQLDGKNTFLGQIYHKMKSRCLSVELEERVKNIFLPFLLTRTSIDWKGCQILGTERTGGFLNFTVPQHCLLINL